MLGPVLDLHIWSRCWQKMPHLHRPPSPPRFQFSLEDILLIESKIKGGRRLWAKDRRLLRWHKSPAVRALHSFIPEMEIINETTRFIQIVCLFIELCIWTWPASQITLVTAAFDGNWKRWFCVMFSPRLKKIRSKIRLRMPHHTPHWSAFSSVSARHSSSCVFKHFQTPVTLRQYGMLPNSCHHNVPLMHIHREKGEGKNCEGKQELCGTEVLFTMNGEVCNLCDAAFDVKLFPPCVSLLFALPSRPWSSPDPSCGN